MTAGWVIDLLGTIIYVASRFPPGKRLLISLVSTTLSFVVLPATFGDPVGRPSTRRGCRISLSPTLKDAFVHAILPSAAMPPLIKLPEVLGRSEERRVGKEC